MTWAALFQVLITFFGPLLADLLRDLFAKAKLTDPPDLLDSWAAVTKAFEVARGQTWRWQLGTRAKLRVAERIALRHATAITNAARDGTPAPRLSAEERDQLLAA